MDEVIVKQSNRKQILLILLGVIMVTTSIYALYTSLNRENITFIVISVIGIIFFGFCLVYMIKKLFFGDKIVVINEEGFYDFSTVMATNNQLIRWEEVKAIRITKVLGNSFVSVDLKNSKETLENQGLINKILIKINNYMGYDSININLNNAKNINSERLKELMQNYLKRSRNVL